MEQWKILTIAFISLITLFVLIVSVLIFIIGDNKQGLSKSGISLEECKTLYYNGENAMNLVFFSPEEKTKRYSDYLINSVPFNEYKNRFNIYFIDQYVPECTLYKDVAVFCHSSELIKRASSCPNDFIVVIKKEDRQIRSTSYSNVMSINENTPLTVLLHEMGHVFTNLDEEYTPASISGDSKNCKIVCDKFNGPHDGCFSGCSRGDYYRSINEGVMRTLRSNDFGIWSNEIIRKEMNKRGLGTIGTGNVINGEIACKDKEYYLVVGEIINKLDNEGRFLGKEIKIISKGIESGCASGFGAGDNEMIIFDDAGNILRNESINIDVVLTDGLPSDESKIEIEGEVFNYEGLFTISLPVTSRVKTLRISDEQNIVNILLDDIGARACLIR